MLLYLCYIQKLDVKRTTLATLSTKDFFGVNAFINLLVLIKFQDLLISSICSPCVKINQELLSWILCANRNNCLVFFHEGDGHITSTELNSIHCTRLVTAFDCLLSCIVNGKKKAVLLSFIFLLILHLFSFLQNLKFYSNECKSSFIMNILK